MANTYDALILVSFGGPECRDDVLPFLENVLRGKPVPRERMLEVAEHYYAFDGISPINAQHRGLLTALQQEFVDHGLDLPIYWGNPEVGRDFNPASFINYHDLGSNDAVIERIIELDQNDDAYLEVIRQPRYPEDSFPDFARPERIRERLRQIVESSESPRRVTGRDRFAHRARYARTKWTRRLQRWRGRIWG